MSTEKAEVEVEIGLGFEAGEDVFIVKGKAKANLTVKLMLVPERHSV